MSISMMGLLSRLQAKMLERYEWIAWVCLPVMSRRIVSQFRDRMSIARPVP